MNYVFLFFWVMYDWIIVMLFMMVICFNFFWRCCSFFIERSYKCCYCLDKCSKVGWFLLSVVELDWVNEEFGLVISVNFLCDCLWVKDGEGLEVSLGILFLCWFCLFGVVWVWIGVVEIVVGVIELCCFIDLVSLLYVGCFLVIFFWKFLWFFNSVMICL